MVNNFQDFCVDQFQTALGSLRDSQFETPSYKYALKNSLIGMYAETYMLGDGTEMKFFDINFASKKYKGRNIWKHLLTSDNAFSLCKEIEEGKQKYNKSKKAAPFYEHIEPKSVTYKALIEYNGTDKKEIKKLLDRSKLVVLTYQEKEYLDGMKYNVFSKDDERIIDRWKDKGLINKDEADEAIGSMKDEKGYLSTNNQGTALARIAHLIAHGVTFKWGTKPNLREEEAIIQYLNSSDHTASDVG